MLSKREFEILESLQNSPEVNTIDFDDEIEYLLDNGMIMRRVEEYVNDTPRFLGFELTPLGRHAFEDYLLLLQSEERASVSLELAKDSNRKATIANIVSIMATAISAISAILSLIF